MAEKTEASSAAVADLDSRTEYSFEELLDDGGYEEPLIANGVRCHGGFDQAGAYRSPRTIYRRPAIAAWQQSLRDAGGDLIDVSKDLIPPQYPNVEQAVLLCRHGVRDPVVRALTVISVVEGFGAVIRDVKLPDFDRWLVEPIQGSALAHLGSGLFEAHARDEAGWGDEGGHKQMWEAARDLAFENPKIPQDVLMRIMGGGGRRARKRERLFPQIDETLESMTLMMSNVLLVEIFAEQIFSWGHAVLSNQDISAEPERAAAMVGYIQSDENPHVEYLRVALSELANRTFRTVDDKTIAGREIIHGTLHTLLSQMTRARPEEQKAQARDSLSSALEGVDRSASIEEEFLSLERPWSPPARTGFESVSAHP